VRDVMTKPDYADMETEDLFELLLNTFVKLPGKPCLREFKRRYDRLLATIRRVQEQYINPCEECSTQNCRGCSYAGHDIGYLMEASLRDVGEE